MANTWCIIIIIIQICIILNIIYTHILNLVFFSFFSYIFVLYISCNIRTVCSINEQRCLHFFKWGRKCSLMYQSVTHSWLLGSGLAKLSWLRPFSTSLLVSSVTRTAIILMWWWNLLKKHFISLFFSCTLSLQNNIT